MPRRYSRTHRQRRNTSYRRSVFTRPSVQITILLVAALIVFILLQSGGR